MNHRSHLALIPLDKLFTGCDDLLVYTQKPGIDTAQSSDLFGRALDNPVILSSSQHRSGPDEPRWKLPAFEWPNVVRRVVENREPLRKVAEGYGVSYETVRRVVKVAQKSDERKPVR